MSVVNPHIRFTYEDYKSLPESMSRRYELLHGELRMVPAPTTEHQFISRNLEFILYHFVRIHDLGTVLYAPVDVVFGQGDDREVVQPDILYISHQRRHIITEEEIQGVPDLIVEILSPGTEQRDRGYKKHLYGRYGVREYWIVDPASRTVETYGGHDFDCLRRLTENQTLTSPLFPGLEIVLKEVFEIR